MAEGLSKALGEPVLCNKVPAAVYRSFGFPVADDLGNMFQFYDEFEQTLNATRDVDRSRELNPELMNFEQWLSKYASKIPV